MATDIDYDENSFKVAAERELQVLSSTVERHGASLQLQLKAVQHGTGADTSLLPVVHPETVIPVKLKLSPYEPEGVYNVRCNIDAVNKVVLALTALCQEVKLLLTQAHQQLVPPILLYGDRVTAESSEASGEPQLCLSRLLGSLSAVQSYGQRVAAVTDNLLQQLAALYPVHQSQPSILATKDVHLQVVWEHLGRLLASLVVLDEAVATNTLLHQHWGAYKRLVRNAPNILDDDADQDTKFDKKTLRPLHRMLADIEKNVLQGNMFKQVCRACSGGSAATNTALRDELLAVTLGWCAQLEVQSSEQWWSDVQQDVVAVSCLYLLHHHLYESPPNKKPVKALVQLYRKVPCVTLAGSLVWHGERYIVSSASSLATVWDNKTTDALMQHRQQHLVASVAQLSKQAQALKIQVAGWSVDMAAAATKPASQFSRQDLSLRTTLFMQGVVLALAAHYTVCSLLNLHASLSRPLGRACVLSLCSLLECLHGVRAVYDTHAAHMLPQSLPLVAQFIVAQLLAAVKQAKHKVSAGRQQRGSSSMDVLGCLELVEQCLGCAAPTNTNTTTARIALSLANQRDTFKDDELSQLVVLLRRLELVTELQARVEAATDLGPQLYLHRVILDTFFASVAAPATTSATVPTVTPSTIQPVLWCVSRCQPWLLQARHLQSSQQLVDLFQESLCGALENKVIKVVCSAVETELRLSTHSHLQLHPRNPFHGSSDAPPPAAAPGTTGVTTASPALDPQPFLELPPINCLGNIIHVKGCVEQYLSRTFYSLTVVAPHDCHTYQEMRALAEHKWGLHTQNTHLPAHTTHQGVDVLEVVRQLSVFVRCYHYSLSQQVFVEAESASKHLNTLNITHIANSIRTHGAGIINSTVNLTYQFLVSKFKVFSQFLFDEQIKSRLIKDRKHWKEVRTAEEKWFPFERAEKFNLGIRKLGVNAQGLSYLDQFRGLVTQMGNAMGYVRLVRSGGLRCSSNTVRFLPDLAQLRPFADLCREDTSTTSTGAAAASSDTADSDDTHEKLGKVLVSDQTLEAANNLDTVIQNLQQTFHKDTDYFKILVEVFSSALCVEANSHLRNFHLIVPALALNFVQHAITAKDLLSKKNKNGAAFTMDGFAMGVAYLLSVLGQGSAFDSLHWWSGVRRYFITHTEKVEKQRSDCLAAGDSKLAETLSLTLARLHQHQQEHELLFLTLTSARGFFRGARSAPQHGSEGMAKGSAAAASRDTSKADEESVKSADSDVSKSSA